MVCYLRQHFLQFRLYSLVQTGDKEACPVAKFIHSSSLSQWQEKRDKLVVLSPICDKEKYFCLSQIGDKEKVVVLSFAISAGKKKTETIE